MTKKNKKKETNTVIIKTKLELVDDQALANTFIIKEICPECGMEDSLVQVGKCQTCLLCGWSLCSI